MSTTSPFLLLSVLYYTSSSNTKMTSTTTLNDNVVKIDNLVTALNFILEDLETRKKEFDETSNLSVLVKENVKDLLNYDHHLLTKIARRAADERWFTLVDQIEERTRGVIKSIIEEHISTAVARELERLGYDKPQVS